MKEIINNDITINILELSSELAHKRVVEYYKEVYDYKSKEEIEDIILIEECGVLIYTDPAQNLFNQLYDEYYTLIEKLAI